ncbi:MAG: carbohydrate-binding domain-containing protein [Ruminococcus sp.]|nr:carbohydrate-binding domain-containing protein [Ruminococcus sp.]
MKKFRIQILAILMASSMILSACSSSDNTSNANDTTSEIGMSLKTVSLGNSFSQTEDTSSDESQTTNIIDITLNNDAILCDSSNVSIDGSTLTITSGGSYSISGTLKDGQIVVDCSDSDKVNIILNGVDVSCSSTSPIYIYNADKTIITLADSSDNTITDSRNAKTDDDTDKDISGSAIYSKDDLTINGNGNLTVTGNYNNGIVCKNDLKLSGGNINVKALNNGIKGSDSVTIKNDVSIDISCDGDGIKTDYDTTSNKDKGYIDIESGNITIKSIGDCLKADTYITIDNGTFDLTSNGGYTNGTSHNNDMGGMTPPSDFNPNQDNQNSSDTSSDSETTLKSKNISADGDITINSGTFNLNASNDCIHSNANIIINDGTFTINAGSKGIHSDYDCTINSGNIEVQNSYEGIEGTNIYVNDGTINITSSNDGFNACDNTETATGSNGFNVSSNAYLEFNGGYTYVNASGDGLDSNGDIKFNGGVVVVEGPTISANGPLDCGDDNNIITIDGGILIAGGAIGMFEIPDSTSTQNTIYSVSTSAKAGDTIVLADENNNVISAIKTSKDMSGVIFSSKDIETGKTYHIYVNPTYNGSFDEYGLASGGTCSDGTDIGSVEVTSTVNQIGSGSVMSGGFKGMNKDNNKNN